MNDHPTRPLGFIVWILAGSAAWGQNVDFGDAPDGIPGCEGSPTCDAVVAYPTLAGTLNAAPGRDAPFHLPPVDPAANFWLGGAPTVEAAALLACCDWLSATAAGDCDIDDGALVLSLGPSVACAPLLVSGIFVGPDPNCGERIAACFGPSPIHPTTGEVWGVWYVEGTTGPGAPAVPLLLNLVVDWDLSGVYGDALLEWVIVDQPLAGPGVSALYTSQAFPVVTVGPDPMSPLGWAAAPFWTRAMVSNEVLSATFVNGDWDGSGIAGGYVGGETEDWALTCDPTAGFEDCNRNRVPDAVDILRKTSRDRNNNGVPDECERAGPRFTGSETLTSVSRRL